MKILFRLLFCAAASAGPAAAQTAVYTIARAAQPPKLDGRLDDPCWRTACKIDRFRKLGGAPASVRTVAWLTYDADALYAAFRCEEPLAGQLVLRAKKHDEPAWKDDEVELFFNPSGDRDRYVQLCINAAGVIMDLYNVQSANESDVAYDAGAQAKARVAAREWTLEVRIPLCNLPIESLTGDWTFHLARHRAAGNELLTSLQTPTSNFHELRAFDVLRGIDLRDWRVEARDLRLGDLLQGVNLARGELRNVSAAPATVTIEAGVEKADPPGRAVRRVVVQPGQRARVAVPWELTSADAGKRCALVVRCDGRVLQRRVQRIETVPPVIGKLPMNAFYCDPNAYVTVRVPIRLAEGSRGGMRLRWTAVDDQGAAAGRGVTVVGDADALVRLYWPRWREGWYTLTFELLRGGRVTASRRERVRLVPSPWAGG